MKQRLEFIPGLNGIRTFSALLVILTHWPGNLLSVKLGWIGVNIFFVLSGFLITRILLVEKEEKNLRDFLSTFYYKRTLRIFPLYFGSLIGLTAFILGFSYLFPFLLGNETWASGYYAVKNDIYYFLSFTFNIKQNLRTTLCLSDNPSLFFGHMWSLALEEQFYLIFPFIVYFATLKNLRKWIIALLVLCPITRLWLSVYGTEMATEKYWLGELIYTNTFFQADALAAGAFLAVYNIKIPRRYLLFFIATSLCLTVGVIHYYYLNKAGYFVSLRTFGLNFPGFWFLQDTPYFLIDIKAFYQFTLVNFLAVSIILPAIAMKPIFPKILTQKHVDYFGRISFGIYVFHNPLIAIMIILFRNVGGESLLTDNPFAELGAFAVFMSVLLLISHLSFQYFESKIVSWGRRPAQRREVIRASAFDNANLLSSKGIPERVA